MLKLCRLAQSGGRKVRVSALSILPEETMNNVQNFTSTDFNSDVFFNFGNYLIR